jgi:hypothetical protein
MHRFLLAALLLGAAAFGPVAPAWAFDYEEPVVPPQFLAGSPPPRPQVLRLQSTTLPVTGMASTSAAVPPSVPPVAHPAPTVDSDSTGCALWNWNA